MLRKISCVLCLLCFVFTITATAVSVHPFTDVPDESQYNEAVCFVYEHGFFMGTDSGLFEPESVLTRAMLVTIIWRMEGKPAMGAGKSGTFSDVPEYEWYTEAAEWCAACEIVYGYGGSYARFGPNDLATREQVYTVLWRYAVYKGCDVNVSEIFGIQNFSDAAEVSEFAQPALRWTLANGLMPDALQYGDSNIRPGSSMTRAQTAYLLRLFCEALTF